MNEELESHLQLDTDERIRRGVSPEEARRQAIIALGGVERTKELVRDQSRVRPLEELGQDIRFALRTFKKERLYFLVTVLSFAIGIGANTAIFAAVNAVLLQPLPYPNGDRLVSVRATDQQSGDDTVPLTPADFADWKKSARSFSAFAASTDAIYTLTGDGAPETIIGYQFAPDMFPTFGLAPAHGRIFDATDGAQVVVLSDRLWRRRFNGDPNAVGKSIKLDQKSYIILGVMPPEYRHPQRTELWTPLILGPETANNRQQRSLRVIGRLNPGVSVEQARAELQTIAAGLAAAYPETNRFRGANVSSYRDQQVGDARPVLLVLLGAVGFVLLLTSSNIAGLSLARAARRTRELALRAALGARKTRLIQQLLTENLLLAIIGGALGVLLAVWGNALLIDLFPKNVANLSIPVVENIPFDARVALFSFGVTLLAALASGLVPAIKSSRTNLAAMLKEGGRLTPRGSRLRPALVAGQIALALILATSAGLTIESVIRKQGALGFDPEEIFTARVRLDGARYPDAERRRQFFNDLIERLRATPAVRSAGVVDFLPLCGWSSGTVFRTASQPEREQESGVLFADPGYFATMRIPIIRGRNFEASDNSNSPRVLIIDERLARKTFGDVDPIGQRLNFGDEKSPDWREIIGVAGDVQNDPPPDPQRPMIYFAFAQSPRPFLGVVMKSEGDPAALLRDAVSSIDPDQPISYAMTMEVMVRDALAVGRTSTLILSFFAIVALLLAAMGIYGVLAHSVLERRHEIGIRRALGAQRIDVAMFMIRRMWLMTAGGFVAGVAGALAVARVLSSLLEGVSAGDPLLLLVVVGILAVIASMAAYFPLSRAVKTDPLLALREQ